MSEENLIDLRNEISLVNQELALILKRRKEIVGIIQLLKNQENLWDPKREIKIFKNFLKEDHTDEECFIFSSIIESQAREFGNYPAWSLGEHLSSAACSIREMTNPILTYIKDPNFFGEQNLKPEIKDQIMQAAKSKVIAIDGPSGSGKSTIAKMIADKLGLTYLDTGAMFRGVAYTLDKQGIEATDNAGITNAIEGFSFQYAKSSSVLIEINNEDLSHKIREHHVSELASKYSKQPEVRSYLKNIQREIASVRPSILEGRDIGSVIFPNAAVKIFLTASDDVRAKRRFDQLKKLGQVDGLSLETIKQDIIERDNRDQQRTLAPLVKADDAVEIDTSNLTIEQVVEEICSIYEKKKQFF